jgi:crossover junction endodeoxyribonuclease RuvC
MRVLGIDPGLGRCGWAVVERAARRTVALGYGTVATHGDEVAPRLAELAGKLREVVATYRPDSFAIERLFVNANVRTAMTVGQASGVALLIAADHDLPVSAYTPSQVKRAVTGMGNAPKAQVGYMVRALLGLDAVPTPADTADALAVALCHLQIANLDTVGWTVAPPDLALRVRSAGALDRMRGRGGRSGDDAADDGGSEGARPGTGGAGSDSAGSDSAGSDSAGRGLASASPEDWLARAAPTSPWRGA